MAKQQPYWWRHGIAVAFALVLCPGVLCGVALDSGPLRLEFADVDRGYAPTGIVNRLSGEVRFLSGRMDAKRPDFWRMAFSRMNATGGVEKVALDNRSKAGSHRVDVSDGKLAFRWQGMDLPGENGVVDVIASIELPQGASASTWRISVANRSKVWGLRETDYPCLNNIVEPGEADVLLPHENLGARLLRRFDGNTQDRRHLWGYYEAPSAVPMVTAFMKNGSGLYVAAHDSGQRIKTMRQKDMCLWFNTPVENMGQAGRAADGPGYDVAVAAFRGDWWEAARMYREWALKQKWASKGPIAGRSDFPKAMAETDFWISFHLLKTIESFTNAIERIREGMDGANLGLRFYRWYADCETGDMCLNFPENFPPRPGVKEVVARFRREGIVVMPYTNPHIYDALLESFNYVLPDACRREGGGWYSEPYAGGAYGRHDFAVMCPCAVRWQAVVDHYSDRIFREMDANAIYYDQVGCGPPRLCFASEHGHPAGGGGWWARGRHEYMESAHAKFSPRNIPVTFEGTGESFMDVCDGNLVVTRATAEDVPFFPAVYSGYAIYFGIRQNVRDQKFDAAFSLMAREFTWGVINGWNWDWPTRDKRIDPRCGDAARLFAHAHAAARDFLVYGSLEGDLNPVKPLERRTFDWRMRWRGDYYEHADLPVVQGTWWRDAAGRRKALVAVNLTDERQSAVVVPPEGFVGLPTVLPVKGQTVSPSCSQGEDGIICTLPPRSVGLFLCVMKKPAEMKICRDVGRGRAFSVVRFLHSRDQGKDP